MPTFLPQQKVSAKSESMRFDGDDWRSENSLLTIRFDEGAVAAPDEHEKAALPWVLRSGEQATIVAESRPPRRQRHPPFNKYISGIAHIRQIVEADVDSPTESAAYWAAIAWKELEKAGLSPDRIMTSAEGGIAICFIKGDKYADIECLNTGENLGVTSNRKDRPTVWEIEPSEADISQAALRIRKFLES
jgi:hypothetical protein